MSYLPRLDAAMTADWPDADWPDLVAEFDRWGEAGRVATLWWRDDDAIAATPRLDDLLLLAGKAPVGLAVVPALARPDLAAALASAPAVAVLQHGWQHRNRAGDGRKSEYPGTRSASRVGAEVAAGRARLTALFGSRALCVFVPPWNRFAPELLPVLAGSGVTGLSTLASERLETLPAGLAALDVHVDVVDWKGGRGFVGIGAALGRLVGCLRAHRIDDPVRLGTSRGPVGILTHHLVMDRATAGLLASLTALIATHPGARWTSVTERLQ